TPRPFSSANGRSPRRSSNAAGASPPASTSCFGGTAAVSEERTRLGPEVFDLPVPEIRIGYRSAVYFSRAKRILETEKPDIVATVQIFQKGASLLCGIDEAMAILRVGTGSWADPIKAHEWFDRYLDERL